MFLLQSRVLDYDLANKCSIDFLFIRYKFMQYGQLSFDWIYVDVFHWLLIVRVRAFLTLCSNVKISTTDIVFSQNLFSPCMVIHLLHFHDDAIEFFLSSQAFVLDIAPPVKERAFFCMLSLTQFEFMKVIFVFATIFSCKCFIQGRLVIASSSFLWGRTRLLVLFCKLLGILQIFAPQLA